MDKKVFEAKKRYAENRMLENSKVDTLTEEQHQALNWLCTIRHEIHVHQEDFFLSESPDFERYWNCIDDGNGSNTINDKLSNAGLDTIDFGIDPLDYCTDYDYSECGMEYDEAYSDIKEMANEFNSIIERYLANIDKIHGTKYCPTGSTRI